MYRKVNSSALVLSITVLQAISTIVVSYTAQNYLVLVLLISPLLTLRIVNHVYLVSLGHAVLLSVFGGSSHLLLHIMSTCIVVLAILAQFLTSKLTRFTSSITIPLLMLMPAYIAAPHLIIYPVVSLTVLLVLATRTYLELSKCTSRVIKTRFTTHVGNIVEIPVEIVCPSTFKYSILVDGKVQASGISNNVATALMKSSSTTLGTVRKVLKVTISDLKEIAKIEHGPFTVEILTTPRLTEVLSKAEEFIKKYATYVSLPLVLKGSIEFGRTSLSVEARSMRGIYGSLPSEGGYFSSMFSGRYYSLDDESSSGGLTLAYTDVLLRPVLSMDARTREYSHKVFLEAPARIRWHLPLHILEKVFERAKSHVGEYIGIREYQPGDSPRAIHWKKSLRTPDKENLVVKLYSTESLEKSGGGRNLVIIADLVTPSLRELDLMLHTVYSILLESVKSPENVAVKAYVYLILPHNKVYLLHGKVVDIVLALNTILIEEGLRALYDYEPYPRIKPPGKPPKGFLEVLDEYFSNVGVALVKDLTDRGIPRRTTVYLVFSRALSYKYATIANVLEKSGYTIGIPTVD